MTIDEAIIHAREVAENRTDLCAECRAEHQQLAEWLQELKAIKNGFTDDLLNMGYTKGYRRGIDDLIFKINEQKTKGYVTGITHNPFEFGACQMADDIVKIAEKLKVGASNE